MIAGEVFFVHFGKKKLMMFDIHGGDGVWMSCWMGGREGRSRLVMFGGLCGGKVVLHEVWKSEMLRDFRLVFWVVAAIGE